jgi:hypothetical protein
VTIDNGTPGRRVRFPHVHGNPEHPHPGQVRRTGGDNIAGGGDRDVGDQCPTHPEGLDGRRDTHPVDDEASQDPAGHPAGQFRSVVGARQGGLEDLPAAGGVGAG